MKLAPVIVSLALLAGCSTPAEVRQDGARHDYTLRLPPEEAVRCMTRNAEEHAGYVTPRVRDGGAEVREIIISGLDSTLAVAEIRPAGSGSRATIWRAFAPALPFGLPDAMAKGC